MSSAWWSVRFDFGTKLLEEPARARSVGAALTRPCFEPLQRLTARIGERSMKPTKSTCETIATYLCDADHEAIGLDDKPRDVSASGIIQNGTYPGPREPAATRFYGYLAVPIVGPVEDAVDALCELASAVDVAAGFVAVEPSYSRAQEVALGFRVPRERAGLSARRRQERRGRDWHAERIATQAHGIEWGTFLGAGHLAAGKLDIGALRASGAFARVIEIAPRRLAFLQLTADPLDDLTDGIEAKLVAARAVLAPIAMDSSDVRLD